MMKAKRKLGYAILVLALAGVIFTSGCIHEELPEPPKEEIAFSYLRCSDYKSPEYAVIGNTYYVNNADPKASDNNDGLSSSYVSGMHGPWVTIQKATTTMTAGDITYIWAGTYKEANIQFRNSGTEKAPITLSAYGSPGSFEQVIIDGTGTEESVGIFLTDSKSNIIVQGMIIQNMYAGLASDERVSSPYKNIVIREVTVRNNDYVGLYLSGVDGFKIDSVKAYENEGDGISVFGVDDRLYAQNGYIVNSLSYNNNDYRPPGKSDAHGIAINQGHTIAICNCTAYGNSDHGFDVSDWPKRGKISYNIALEGNTAYSNKNGGFSVNSDSHHVLHLRNLAYDNGVGFLCYEGCGHTEYYHNVALRNRYGGFRVEKHYAVYVDPGDNTIILKNNIAYNNGMWDPGLCVEGNNYEVVATHNNWQVPVGQDLEYLGNIAAVIGKTTYSPSDIDKLGEGSLSTNPVFVDGDSKIPDIHLVTTSEMIDSGTVITIKGKSESYNGTAPDIGAYEYFQINSSGFIS